MHSVYVFSLPVGPIWVLHGFYLLSGALMLWWWWRYHRVPQRRAAAAEIERDQRSAFAVASAAVEGSEAPALVLTCAATG